MTITTTNNSRAHCGFSFVHPVTGETFKAEKVLEHGLPFLLSRLDDKYGWVFCGEVSPYTPQPILDAISVKMGAEILISSFTHEQQILLTGMSF